MAMTQTKTEKLKALTEALTAEMKKAGEGTTNKIPALVGRIERILLSEGLIPELTPSMPDPENIDAKCLIRKWYDADGQEIAEARHVGVTRCRCESALIAAATLLPRKPGRPPKA